MVNVTYKLCDPNGNITALVTDKVDKANYISIADEIMKNEPTCEQVGFLSFDTAGADIRLDMAGGEFCGNATLCTAAYKKSLDETLNNVKVSVSGTNEILEVKVAKENDIYTASVDMPMPRETKEMTLEFDNKQYKVFKVDLGSIVHLIMDDGLEESQIKNAMDKWCKELKTDALGLMFFDEEKSFLSPYVLCKNPDTFFLEHSCASGTTALGIYLTNKSTMPIEREIYEPGGMLKIKTEQGKRVNLTGTVKFIKF